MQAILPIGSSIPAIAPVRSLTVAVPAETVGRVVTGVGLIADCIRDRDVQRTERVRIVQESMLELERIRTMRKLTHRALDTSALERRETQTLLGARLDLAIERNNEFAIEAILEAMTRIASTSPLDTLSSEATAALGTNEKE